ncbi:site-specific integrase [Peribacillus simplex]|uniref:site-specific integrase n=1 Tax=Peribacillus simplex TaxID=1478 RepID=UPI00119DD51A|nr:site-specific integrase [Peribacillus simplex]
MSYQFVVFEYPLVEVVGGKPNIDKYIGFGLRDNENNLIYPLPITKFLDNYRNKSQSLKGQKNAAEAIKRFLNYCIGAVAESKHNPDFDDFSNLAYQGLQGLKLKHGSIYITHLTLRCKYEGLDCTYVRKDIRYLNKFYYYLQEEGLIEKQFEPLHKEVTVIAHTGKKKLVKQLIEIDIFDKKGLGTVYPPQRSKKAKRKKNLKDFGSNRYLLIKEFIEVAEAVEPEIVVGIYLQFFGGLRRGEVVNVLRKGLMETEDGFIVDIDDHRDVLFLKKKNTETEQVKYPRYQGLFCHKSMLYTIKKHTEWLDSLEKEGKLKNKNALLINRHTGLPITGSNYAEKFNRVKEAFLKKLADEHRVTDHNFLTAKPWSTHIGRGCFTNFCLDIGMKIGEVAVARGDSNVNSVLDYLEEKVAVQTLKRAIEHIQKAFDYSDQSGDITKVESRLDKHYTNFWGNKHDN